jgi:ribonucleotide reductase alpha subunit
VPPYRHLLRDLIQRGLWTDDVRRQLIAHSGSVQRRDRPGDLKEPCKTVWEVKQLTVRDMAAYRGAYSDQSQSLSIHMVDATTAKLSSTHFHDWQLEPKTGVYHLRTKVAVDAIKFTVDVDQVKRADRQPPRPRPRPVRCRWLGPRLWHPRRRGCCSPSWFW